MYGSIYDEDGDNGEEYHLDIPFDWWAKSWEEAKEDFENVYHPIVLPWFMAYLFLGVQTIIHIIKRKKWYKQVKKEENMTDIEVLEYTDSRITELEKENAKLKAEFEGIKNKVKQILLDDNAEIGQLREVVGLEWCDKDYVEKIEKENEELKAHCKAVDEVNVKMKCGGNCKHSYSVNTGGCYDTKCELTGCDCINCKDKWELVE